MDNELALRLFVRVVEENSFSRAGARMGVPQSSASRMISRLEERLGARLLQRSTRNLTLTEAGQIYFERASRIVTELDQAAEAVRDVNAAPKGLLRVAAPASFGRQFIAPALKEFHDLYPDITIGLSLSDIIEDVIGLGFDVAIRLGELQDSGLIASRLTGSTSILCASSAYLHAHEDLKAVEDLALHNSLQFRTNPGSNTWRFMKDDVEHSIQVSGSMYANDGDALLSAALTGLGVCFLPEWMVRTHLDDGSLVRVLPGFEPKMTITPIQAVVGYRQFIPAKQRVFVEFLRGHLSKMSWAKS
ncbi:MAG: LysR family transcriptional regulator [Halopseudomonas aestusnigri]